MLIPTGFWSYTTSDDTSSRGKLSQLRALLAAELQQQVGRDPKVNIFQDVAAIPPGAEWERQIRESIDRASFIIPIVTPGFLQSEWCCREVTLFREREKKLGIGNLIFPIHYVDTEHPDGGDQEVLRLLRTRQWIDFRHLRFRSLESEDVALLLESLSRGILKALREAWLVQQRAEAERQREEAAREAAEAERREAAAREARLAEVRRQEAQQKEASHRKAAEAAKQREEEVAQAMRREKAVLQAGDAAAQQQQVPEANLKPGRDGDEANTKTLQAVNPEIRLSEGTSPQAAATRSLGGSAIEVHAGAAAAPRRTLETTRSERSSVAATRAIAAGIVIVITAITLIGGLATYNSLPRDPNDPTLERLKQAARSGDAGAMGELGERYYDGTGVPQSYAKADDWLEKAAAAGDAAAMKTLGRQYWNGEGVSPDYRKAFEWFKKSAVAGNATAMYYLGYLYENGYVVQQNYAKARQWFEKGAAAGSAEAMWNLANFLEDGTDGAKDTAEAAKWKAKVINAPIRDSDSWLAIPFQSYPELSLHLP